jgi:hypothetical protein
MTPASWWRAGRRRPARWRYRLLAPRLRDSRAQQPAGGDLAGDVPAQRGLLRAAARRAQAAGVEHGEKLREPSRSLARSAVPCGSVWLVTVFGRYPDSACALRNSWDCRERRLTTRRAMLVLAPTALRRRSRAGLRRRRLACSPDAASRSSPWPASSRCACPSRHRGAGPRRVRPASSCTA